jgi:large subunit ribosomal protein L9
VAVKYNGQEHEKERVVKVIFLEDVPNVARAGETKVVADGYARNYLLRRRLAILAGSQASTIVEAQLRKRERLMAQTEAEMAALAAKLNGMSVSLAAKAGAAGRLYGSVTSADVADLLGKSVNSLIDKRKVELAQPIHQVGSYDVTVRFTSDIAATVKLAVTAEGVEAPPAEAVAPPPAEAPVAAAPAAEEPEAEKKEKKPKAKKAEEAAAEAEPKAEKKEKKAKAEKKVKETKAEAAEEPKAEKTEKKAKAPKKVKEAKAEAAPAEAEAEPKKEKKAKAPKEKKAKAQEE